MYKKEYVKGGELKVKIYKVIHHSFYLEECEDYLDVKVFTDKDKAKEYMDSLIDDYTRQDMDSGNAEDLTVEKTDNSYERYLTERYAEDNVTILLEEDDLVMEKTVEHEDFDYEKE